MDYLQLVDWVGGRKYQADADLHEKVAPALDEEGVVRAFAHRVIQRVRLAPIDHKAADVETDIVAADTVDPTDTADHAPLVVLQNSPQETLTRQHVIGAKS
jgi:hypothetical protein